MLTRRWKNGADWFDLKLIDFFKLRTAKIRRTLRIVEHSNLRRPFRTKLILATATTNGSRSFRTVTSIAIIITKYGRHVWRPINLITNRVVRSETCLDSKHQCKYWWDWRPIWSTTSIKSCWRIIWTTLAITNWRIIQLVAAIGVTRCRVVWIDTIIAAASRWIVWSITIDIIDWWHVWIVIAANPRRFIRSTT